MYSLVAERTRCYQYSCRRPAKAVEVSINIFKDDYLFTVGFDISFIPLRATARPALLRWIEDVERVSKRSEAIGEL